MAKTNLITHSMGGKTIMQRESDGYLNATAMCKAAGKLIANYRQNESTSEFLEALSSDIGIPISDLIQVVRGGKGQQGTWVHPKVAIHLAQWLNPQTAVKVTNWVHDWMINGVQPNKPPQKQLPAPKQETTPFIPEIITTVITIQRGQPPQSQTYEDDVLVIPRVTFQEHVRRTSVDFIHNLNSLDEFRLLG